MWCREGGGERLAAEFRPDFTLLNEQKSGAVVISSAIRERRVVRHLFIKILLIPPLPSY